AADGVELVDEHDRGRRLLRLLEQIAHARRTHADDRLDELRGSHREEWNVRLAGNGTRKQRLAGTGRPREQDAVRDAAAELAVLVGMTQEIDDLRQLGLRLVDAGDIRERDAIAGGLVPPRPGAAEIAQDVLHVPGAPHQPEEQKDEQDRRAEAEQQVLPPRHSRVEWLRDDDDTL